MNDYKEVDYQQDHQAIPSYRKEPVEAITHKKKMFFHLAKAICNELEFKTHLDIGCGSGYLVSSMRKLERESFGAEVGYMFHHGIFPEVKDYVYEESIFSICNLNRKFDLITAMELLEHLYAENFYRNELNNALINLVNISANYLFFTVPILTPEYCDWLDWKGRSPEVWPRILRKEEVPLHEDGTPILGHVTLATEAWWRTKFESFGLRRAEEAEKNINKYLTSVDKGLLEWWHIFIYKK